MSGSHNPAHGLGGGKGAKIETGTGGTDMETSATANTDDTNVASGSFRGPTVAPSVKPIDNWQKGGQVFRHKRIVTTFIHNFKFINANTAYKGDNTGVSGAQYYLVTPYAYVPADIIGFYFTENELAELPLTAEATHFSTVVRPIGYRLPFQTQASGTTYANSMTDIIGMFVYGLNNTFNGRNMIPTYSATEPTDITNVTSSKPLNQPFFPTPWKADEISTLSTRAVSGMASNILPLTNYFVATGVMEEGQAGEPLIMDSITTFDMMNKGNVNITYEYRPEICILKSASAAMPFWKVTYDTTAKKSSAPQIILGRKYAFPTFLNATFDTTANKFSKYRIPDYRNYSTYVEPGEDVNVMDMHVEMAGLMSRGVGEMSSAFLPPTLHIGGLPVDSHITTTGNRAQPCIIMWEITTEATVSWNYSYTHATNRHCKRECVTYGPADDKYLAAWVDQNYAFGM